MTQGEVPKPLIEDESVGNIPLPETDAVDQSEEAVEGHATGSRFHWPVTALRRMTTRHLVVDPAESVVPVPPPVPSETGSDITIRQPFALGFYATIGALVAIGLAMTLISLKAILLIVLLSLFIALGLNPMVEWLTARKFPRGLAVVAVMVGLLVVVVLGATALLPVVTEQGTALYKNAPSYIQSLRENQQIANLDAQYHFIARLTDFLTNGSLLNSLWNGLLGAGALVVNALFSLIVTIVLTAYFLSSLPQIKTTIYLLSPGSRRPRAKYLADEMFTRIGGYVTSMTIDVVIAGFVFFVFLSFVGIPQYALALAFMVALLTYIPLIGGMMNIVIVSLIGLSVSPTVGVICLVFCVLYQQFDTYFTQPRLMARQVKVPGALVVVAALAGGTTLGIPGAVMAVPLAAALLLIYREVVLPALDAR
ncbi:MAG: AI-2E family transporter [Actinobacteria bacterium]|nr:AI-2E family transporter [Actinomycetota bacterium]